MWPRVIEVFLGLWLAISPFVFRRSEGDLFPWVNDFLCAGWLMLFSLLSFAKAFERAHLFNLLAGVWMIAAAFLMVPVPPPPPYQNYAVVGLLTLMVAILPSRADQPPRSWRKFYEKRVECEVKEIATPRSS